MEISIAEKKVEAIKRMKLIKLLPSIIEDFEKRDVLYYSEKVGVLGILYWVSNKPEWEKHIKEFEIKYNAFVYHAELSHLEFGDCLSLFYVSDHKDEWEQDYNNLKDGYALVFVWNINDEFCSEFGSIMFKSVNGGVVRTA